MPVRKRKQLEKAAMKQTPKRSADDAPIASTGTSYSAYGHSIPISDAEALLQMHRSFEQQPHERISDVHPRVNDVGLVHTQDAERRKFAGASSSSIFLKWLDSESTGSHLTKHLRYGVTTSETYTFPGMLPSTPTLPKPEWTQAFLQRYFVTIHSMIPFVDEQTMRNLAASPDPSKEDPLSLVLLELVLSHGALTGDIVEGYAQESERLFQHAWTAIPAVLASPFRLSVQILGLICLGLRSVSHHCSAWMDCTDTVQHRGTEMEQRGILQELLSDWRKAWGCTTRRQGRRRRWTRASGSARTRWTRCSLSSAAGQQQLPTTIARQSWATVVHRSSS